MIHVLSANEKLQNLAFQKRLIAHFLAALAAPAAAEQASLIYGLASLSSAPVGWNAATAQSLKIRRKFFPHCHQLDGTSVVAEPKRAQDHEMVEGVPLLLHERWYSQPFGDAQTVHITQTISVTVILKTRKTHG